MTRISLAGRFFTAILLAALLAFAPLALTDRALASGGAQLLKFDFLSDDDTGIKDDASAPGTSDGTSDDADSSPMDIMADDPMPIGTMDRPDMADSANSAEDISSAPVDEVSMSDADMDDDEGGISFLALAALAAVIAGIAYLLFRRPSA